MVRVWRNSDISQQAQAPGWKISRVGDIALKSLALLAGVAFATTLTFALLHALPPLAAIVTGVAFGVFFASIVLPLVAPYAPESVKVTIDFFRSTIKDLLIAPIFGGSMMINFEKKNGLEHTKEARHVNIDKVITLGSPMEGTEAACLGVGSPGAKQMGYKSEYVNGLNAWINTQSKVQFFHYGTKSDAIVFPHTSPFAEGKHRVSREAYQGIGHLGLLFSDKVVEDMVKDLGVDKEKPILLVHGFLGHSSNWWYIRYRLQMMGYKNLFTVNLGHPFKAIDKDYAPRVEKVLKRIVSKTHRKDVTLVGHSMGGLVSAQVAKNLIYQKPIK